MSSSVLKSVPYKARVSSVLNKDVKQFGKDYLFDGSEETCWNSHQGSPQWVHVSFERPVDVSSVHLMFQGGFVGKDVEVWAGQDTDSMVQVQQLQPRDDNTLQKFSVSAAGLTQMRISFTSSTDFFGRIILYTLDILGPQT
eukprot:TRINITY_DN7823_c0_g1_i2.p1 TRINITY_DN7823_c0_g1~~TRINITY_DN7823_c0_g1_i2.p1  ORF type:complete len:150 (+),score=35.39 TRINITY_DN7823_c0_g1_i2:30-452(+)